MMRLAAAPAAAGTTAAPDLQWNFSITAGTYAHGKTAISAVDGGYLLAGEYSTAGTVDSTRAIAVGITEPVNGGISIKWGYAYGDGNYSSFSDAVADSNGYVFVGSSKDRNPPQTDAWLLHTDSNGWGDDSTYWQRLYPGVDDQGSTGKYGDLFNAVVRTFSGFAAAGTTGSYHPDTVSHDAYLIDIYTGGNSKGSGAYDGTDPKIAESIRQTPDNGFILAGSTTPAGSTQTKLLLIRVNEDMSIRWQATLGSNPENGAYDVRQTSDDGFIASGYTVDASGHRFMYLVRTDANGKVLWEATPASDRTTAEGRGIVQTDDGGFLIAGSSAGALVVKVDSNGTTEWEKIYLTQYPDSTVASLERTANGGFLIGGTRIQPDKTGMWIIKLGPEKTVQKPIALPGYTNPPTDPDHYGLYEDLNGNDAVTFTDVFLFFKNIDWITINEPVSAFDFAKNGVITFKDAMVLFKEM